MEKRIVFLKRGFIITGLLSTLLLVIDLLFRISINTTNGLYLALTGLMFIIFVISLYLFFMLSDIKKDKLTYLSSLNYFLLIASVLFFIYWGIIHPDALAFLYPAYLGIMTLFNLIVMSIVYYLKKTGGNYFFKDWLLFIALIVFYISYNVIMKVGTSI